MWLSTVIDDVVCSINSDESNSSDAHMEKNEREKRQIRRLETLIDVVYLYKRRLNKLKKYT